MYTPATEISLKDFQKKAIEEGCAVSKNQKGEFIGEQGANNYPHIHVWQDGTIALSVGQTKNQKIGKDEVINIADLTFAYERFTVPDGSLKKTIEWVMSSAS